jgi:hypothetical protein
MACKPANGQKSAIYGDGDEVAKLWGYGGLAKGMWRLSCRDVAAPQPWECVASSTGIGGRDIKYFCRRYPISDIDIAYSDIGQKFVGLKASSPISD